MHETNYMTCDLLDLDSKLKSHQIDPQHGRCKSPVITGVTARFCEVATIAFFSAVISAGGLEVSFGKSENCTVPHLMIVVQGEGGDVFLSKLAVGPD